MRPRGIGTSVIEPAGTATEAVSSTITTLLAQAYIFGLAGCLYHRITLVIVGCWRALNAELLCCSQSV
jgi:hypothetical protein